MPDAHHGMVFGPSDSGKTTLMREMHARCPGPSVWVNHNDTRGVVGARAEGREAMQTAVGRFDRWRDVRINLQIENVFEATATAAAFAVDVWDTVGVPVQILCDEVHHLIPKGAPGPEENIGLWCFAEGRGHGIKFVAASQAVDQVEFPSAIGDAKYWVPVGEMVPRTKGFRDFYGVPSEEIRDEQYHYTVLSRKMEVLHRGETDEKYS